MLLNLQDVRRAPSGKDLEGVVEMPRVAEENVGVVSLDPVRAKLHAAAQDHTVHVEGNLATTIEYECSRCLDTYHERMTMRFDERFTDTSSHESDEVNRVDGEEVDLNPWIEETVNLHIEYRPLCKDDCQGLCAECGTNLNHGWCSCDRQRIDPRLSVLQDLLSDKNSE